MYTLTVAQDFPSKPFSCYLDLHGMRNLYLFSSSLANYDIISNFNQDTIIKKKILLELIIMKLFLILRARASIISISQNVQYLELTLNYVIHTVM